MALENDVILGLSLGANVIFFLLFQKLHGMWATPGMSNFFTKQIKVAFNRIRNPKIVVGANSSRFAPLDIIGDNEPIYPDPTNKVGLPLQFEPKHMYRAQKGTPLIFANQGALSNSNPLESSNDDVELAQISQSTLKFIDIEVERRYSHDNPIQKLSRMIFILGAVMVLGFFVLGAILINIQGIANGFNETIQKYKVVADRVLANPEEFGLPTNIIGANPNTPPPTNPGLTGGLIPGV